MPSFRQPLVNLYSRDLPRAAAFYLGLGFVETFRTPAAGDPVHVELVLDGFKLGIASIETAHADHGLSPKGEGRWIEVALWTDDTAAAARLLADEGAPGLSP